MTRELAVEQWNRQLLERHRGVTIEEAVRMAGGLYSTAPTSYLSCAARIPGFARDDLDRALYRDRTLVRMGALRGSGFLIPIDMVDQVRAAKDKPWWYLRAVDKAVGEEKRSRWHGEILRMLHGQILTAAEIRERLGVDSAQSEPVRFLLSHMARELEIVAAGEPGGWRSNRYGYALWGEWFRGNQPEEIDGDEARVEVARWYLKGHGPGTVDHFAWWAGIKKTNAAAALVRFDEVGDGLFDLSDAPESIEPSGLRLLPVWDTALVAPKGRRRMVRTAHQPFVYDASGNVTSTIVRDGGVIGVWDRGGDDEHLHIKAAAFERFDAGTRRAIESEAGVIGSALGVGEVALEYVPEPTDLHAAPRNRFLSPLSDS